MLRDGTVDSRSAAAEKLFNKAAEDETARQRTASLGVVQPLVSHGEWGAVQRPYVLKAVTCSKYRDCADFALWSAPEKLAGSRCGLLLAA